MHFANQAPQRENEPVCEECDLPMVPFAYGETHGYSCQGCGWSVDNEWPRQA
jgi:tRNA(Ile2) C34 agmatinyltransferase TiaS